MSEKDKTVVVVSACLLGDCCRYDGKNNFSEKTVAFIADKTVIKICPEIAGGLTIPREPCEIKEINGKSWVVTKSGKDVTAEFLCGAQESLVSALKGGAKLAILKSQALPAALTRFMTVILKVIK